MRATGCSGPSDPCCGGSMPPGPARNTPLRTRAQGVNLLKIKHIIDSVNVLFRLRGKGAAVVSRDLHSDRSGPRLAREACADKPRHCLGRAVRRSADARRRRGVRQSRPVSKSGCGRPATRNAARPRGRTHPDFVDGRNPEPQPSPRTCGRATGRAVRKPRRGGAKRSASGAEGPAIGGRGRTRGPGRSRRPMATRVMAIAAPRSSRGTCIEDDAEEGGDGEQGDDLHQAVRHRYPPRRGRRGP